MKVYDFLKIEWGLPRGKRDGVIGHILRRECENSIKIERYCVIDTSGVIVNNHFVRRENEKMNDN